MSTKTGVCACGQTVAIPKYECIFQCHGCRNLSIFLCHIIPQPYDLKNLRCNLCDQSFMLYTCPKCQSSSVIKDFRSGYIYNCLCGFQSNMINCNKCTSLLLLPTRKIYENTIINCKTCKNVFKYMICGACKQCLYYSTDQNEKDIDYCNNSKCRKFKQPKIQSNAYLVQKQFVQSKREPIRPQIEELTNNVTHSNNPYITVREDFKQKKAGFKPELNEQKMCNICSFREKCMINTTCFHLSVCEQCSKKINNKCPICNQLGNYNKVYQT